MDPGFDILYENGSCLVICKPSGVLTQAPPGVDSIESRVKRFLKQRDQRTGSIYLGVPHRLDRATSGTMVFAKNRKAARQLSAQFERRYIAKTYWAIVEGHVAPPTGTWTDRVRKIPGEPLAEIVDENHEEGRRAELSYQVREATDDMSWLEIELKTGRMHQIRVQSASRGHPVVGDWTYGSTRKLGDESIKDRLRPMALHARSLGFRDPTTQEDVTVVADVPSQWERFGLSQRLADDS
jgi:23S rRNA pseudouridine1911/1915/1917 synthase